jgi:hypothetical protein
MAFLAVTFAVSHDQHVLLYREFDLTLMEAGHW